MVHGLAAAIRRVGSKSAAAVSDPDKPRWFDNFNTSTRSIFDDQQWLDPRMQAFVESLSPNAGRVHRDLLMAWTKANRQHVMTDIPAAQRALATKTIQRFQGNSNEVNDATHEESVVSLETLIATAADDVYEAKRLDYSVLAQAEYVARTLFTGYATSLPVGLVLFEGRTASSLDTPELGVGDVVTRSRFTSTSWHPASALVRSITSMRSTNPSPRPVPRSGS
jgi:hypothetical protein